MEKIERSISSEYFSELVGEEVLKFIQKKAPTKVWWRIVKAMDHAEKAMLLNDVDDEMGAIRLIAAEEELVVSIFEWLKLNESKMPEHSDLVRSYKNHQVKLMFYPVLSVMHEIIRPMIQDGVSFEGLEHYQMTIVPKIDSNSITFHLHDPDGKEIIPLNPLATVISLDDKTSDEVSDSLFQELVNRIKHSHNFNLKTFVTRRSDFRNKLLYSEDGGFMTGGDTVTQLLENGFHSTFRELLWTIAILLGNDPISPNLGLASQFISVYRRVLLETKAMRSRGDLASTITN